MCKAGILTDYWPTMRDGYLCSLISASLPQTTRGLYDVLSLHNGFELWDRLDEGEGEGEGGKWASRLSPK